MSLVGLLVTMVIIVVLFSVLMTSLNTAITGAGNTLPGSAASARDQVNLQQLFQSFLADSTANGNKGYLTPSKLDRFDWSVNTSASLWSSMIMRGMTSPNQLISANERNPRVEADGDYRYDAHNPAGRVYWDPSFVADLETGSNVSFAHMPLFGERYQWHWERPSLDGRFPLLGSRGPKDGVPNPMSYTNGRNGTWAGHVVFADGHVAWTESMTPEGLSFERSGRISPDNLFALDDGADGRDGILAFTREMSDRGPTIQWD